MNALVSRLRFIPFEIPTAVSEPPEGDEWIHEVKLDGYRTQVVIDNGAVTAYSRRRLNWSDRYPGVIAEAKELPVKSAILNGETVIMDQNGVTDFAALVRAVHKKSAAIVFIAFDLLHLNGIDLRKEALLRRRNALSEVIPDEGYIQFADHFAAPGKEIFEAARELGLEGIVSKRATAPYRSGPSRNWLKTKNYAEIELAILGIVQEAGKPTMALLGNAEDRAYIGSASVVINKLSRDLFWQAVELLADPDRNPPDDNTHWLRPGLIGRVRYLSGGGGLQNGLRHGTVRSVWLEGGPTIISGNAT